MTRIRAKKVKKMLPTKQSVVQKGEALAKQSRFKSPPFAQARYGVVQRARSETNTVDVLFDVGALKTHVAVASREYAGANSTIGFGERDLPPVGSPVIVLFPNGVDEDGIVLCSVLTPIGSPSTLQKKELLVANKEREKLVVNEVGWKVTYDKDSGDYTIESPSTDTNQIKVTLNRTSDYATIEVGSVKIKVAATGIEIDSSTGIKLKTGDSLIWQPNVLAVDPFSGIVHGGAGAGIILLTGG